MKPILVYGEFMSPNPQYKHSPPTRRHKVRIILEELEIPYQNELVKFNEVKTESYRRLNVNGRLPTIHDPNTGITLWESGAITTYLIETYDKEHRLSYGTSPEKFLIHQWIAFQISGQGPYYGQGVWFSFIHPDKLSSAMERYDKEIERVRSVIDAHLQIQASTQGSSSDVWLVGDKCTVADLSFVMWENVVELLHARKGIDLKGQYPAYDAWKEKLFERPTCKKAIARRAEAMGVELTTGSLAGRIRED